MTKNDKELKGIWKKVDKQLRKEKLRHTLIGWTLFVLGIGMIITIIVLHS